MRALLAFLLLLSTGLAAGCREAAPPPARIDAAPALWRIETAAGEPTGWLFGTIHALPDDIPWETPALRAALRDADTLVVEVRDPDPTRAGAMLQALATDEPVPALAARVAANRRGELASMLADSSISAGALDRLETWAAALALARTGGWGSPDNGVDRVLIARFPDTRVIELEGLANQLALFDGLAERDQRAMLNAVVAAHAGAAGEARRLGEAWLAGDLATIEQATRGGLLAEPRLYQALLARRNAAWLPAIEALLEDGRTPLVAVGAAHMVGRDGLPALLERAGYRVGRIQ